MIKPPVAGTRTCPTITTPTMIIRIYIYKYIFVFIYTYINNSNDLRRTLSTTRVPYNPGTRFWIKGNAVLPLPPSHFTTIRYKRTKIWTEGVSKKKMFFFPGIEYKGGKKIFLIYPGSGHYGDAGAKSGNRVGFRKPPPTAMVLFSKLTIRRGSSI